MHQYFCTLNVLFLNLKREKKIDIDLKVIFKENTPSHKQICNFSRENLWIILFIQV